MRTFDFPVALDLMRLDAGAKCTRAAWKDQGCWIEACPPSPPMCGYLRVCWPAPMNLIVPWQPSQDDMFATDWHLLTEKE